MYLEGSDQHRGWFQSSILTAVGTTGTAPFETVLTHGFVVDDKGEKISKSQGNYIPADKMTNTYGADVLRLYVASMDYANDISVSERGIKEMSEAYRKIRNTFRYLLGNLEDYQRFDPERVDPATLHEIDRWVLGQLNKVIRDVRAAYEQVRVLPGLPADLPVLRGRAVELLPRRLKDRLYAEAPDGPDRRAAQFVLAPLHDHLTRLLAPIIPHTADESVGVPARRVVQAGQRAPGRVPRARSPVGRRRRATPAGTSCSSSRADLDRARGLRKEQDDRQRPGGEGADRDQPARIAGCPIASCWRRSATFRRSRSSPIPPADGRGRHGRALVLSPSASGAGTIGRPSARDAEHPTLCERCVRVIGEMSGPGRHRAERGPADRVARSPPAGLDAPDPSAIRSSRTGSPAADGSPVGAGPRDRISAPHGARRPVSCGPLRLSAVFRAMRPPRPEESPPAGRAILACMGRCETPASNGRSDRKPLS